MDVEEHNEMESIDQLEPTNRLLSISDTDRLERFCILGCESSTYRVNIENILDNIGCVNRLIDQRRHREIIAILKKISSSGRNARADPILTVLAICGTHVSPDVRDLDAEEKKTKKKLDAEVRKVALDAVVDICNISTKLFRFIEISQKKRSGRRGMYGPIQPPKKGKKKREKSKGMESQLERMKLEKKKFPNENDSEPPSKKKKKDEDDPVRKTIGWGRMRRKAIGKFYSDERKDACRLLYLMTKYKKRHGWSHKDVIKYSHPKVPTIGDGKEKKRKDLVIRYSTKKFREIKDELEEMKGKPGIEHIDSLFFGYIDTLEEVRNLQEGEEGRLVEILKTHGVRDCITDLDNYHPEAPMDQDGSRSPIHIVWEHIPTWFLKSPKVWEGLLQDMPMTCLFRNLGKMTHMKLFEKPDNVRIAVESMTNHAKLKKAKVHPINILIALETYKNGGGVKGKIRWEHNEEILAALEEAVNISMIKDNNDNNELKTNKKYMIGIDVSGNMFSGKCFGLTTLSPAQVAFAMAWATWNIEDDANVNIMAFSHHFVDLKDQGFRQDMKISAVLEKAQAMKPCELHIGPDCSRPMEYATKNSIEVDAFIVYTDNKPQAGVIEPVEALRQYNNFMRCDARLIVVGMSADEFTIADPENPNMLNIIGFDKHVPSIISWFLKKNPLIEQAMIE